MLAFHLRIYFLKSQNNNNTTSIHEVNDNLPGPAANKTYGMSKLRRETKVSIEGRNKKKHELSKQELQEINKEITKKEQKI